MSQFDPYVEWLGIRDSTRPPYHYRLLAIELFESDPDVIANAADRQMAFLRTLQTGGRVQESQQLLSEVAAAKTCLLNATRKDQYDAWLREQLRGRQPAPAETGLPVVGDAAKAAASAPAEDAFAFVADADKRSAPLASQHRRKKKSPAVPLALAGGGLVFVVVVLLVIMTMGGDSDQPRPAADNVAAAEEPRRQAEIEPPQREPQPEPQRPAADPTPQPADPPATKLAWETPPTDMVRNAIDSFNQSREYRMSHEVSELLNRARTELGHRQLKAAADTLAEAKLVIQTDDDQSEVARFEALLQLLSEFWQEAETHLAAMQPGDELPFGPARAMLASIDERQFVLADGSAQQSFLREFEQLPANVAVALVAAGPLQVRDQLRIAAFWAVDRAGDLPRAQFSANAAREQGLDAGPVLQEIAFNPSLVSVVGGPRVGVGDQSGPGGFADSTHLVKEPAAERLAVPNGDELNAALAELKTSLEAQYAIAETPAGRTHLMRTLLGRLDQTLSPTARYAMLFEIQKLAIAGGDAAVFLDATGQMAARFDIDKGRFLGAGMARIGETLSDDAQRKVYLEQGLPVIDELMQADQYEAADSLLKNLANVARQVGSVSAETRKAITDKRKEVVEAKTLYERFAQAQQTLTTEPDDPAGNHMVGTYLAWQKGDWQQALPHLAKSSDPQIKTAATIELASPRTAVEQSSLADLWWAVAEGKPETDPAALAVRKHAAKWYQSALPGLAGDQAAHATARVEAARKIVEEIESGPEMHRAMIDDDMVGFDMTRSWSVGMSSGFEGRFRYALPSNGRYQALWIFDKVPRGKYQVFATWPTGRRLPEPRGSNVVYVMKDGGRQVGTETVSQAVPARKDLEIKGHAFQQLGVVEVKSGEFRMLLTDVANGYVIADAVAIVQVE